ncbi:MAG: hypothetical protein AAB664_01840, partial [Patescibacteria group bacterium]
LQSNDFTDDKKSDASFHVMTHEIYAFEPKTEKDRILFEELLCLTREVSFQRQELVHSLSSPISPYTWTVFLFVGLISIFLLFLIRDNSLLASLYTYFVTIMVFLIGDLLLQLTQLSTSQKEAYQNMYAENAKRIEQE